LHILKLDEKEEVQQEKFIDKNEQVELECDQIDHLLERKVELFFDQEIL
jgi:hypothetical protein